MSGAAIEVISRTKYNFDNIPIGATFSMPIARYVDISRFREATLLVRVHTKSILATGSPSIAVAAYADVPSSDDPSQDFLSTAVLGTNTSITSATTAPSVQLQALPASAGAMISIWLVVLQGTSVAALQTTISVEVSEKS